MSIVAATYVDHQDVINYPIAWCVRDLPKFCDAVYVFASDEMNASILREQIKTPGVEVRVLGHKIRTPDDTPKGENKAKRLLFEEGAQHVLFFHADIWVTEAGIPRVRELQARGIDYGGVLRIERPTLYMVNHPSVYGAVVFGRDCLSTFDEREDGGPMVYDSKFSIDFGYQEGPLQAVEIGYYNIDMYGKHKTRHIITYNQQPWDIRLVNLYNKNRREFARACLRRIRDYERAHVPLEVLDVSRPHHALLLDAWGLHDEHKMVMEVYEEIKDEPQRLHAGCWAGVEGP